MMFLVLYNFMTVETSSPLTRPFLGKKEIHRSRILVVAGIRVLFTMIAHEEPLIISDSFEGDPELNAILSGGTFRPEEDRNACPNCDAELDFDVIFCEECGQKLDWDATTERGAEAEDLSTFGGLDVLVDDSDKRPSSLAHAPVTALTGGFEGMAHT